MRTEVRDRELGHVGEHQRDVLTRLETELDEPPGELLRQAVQLGVADLRIVDDDRRVVGVLLCTGAQDRGKVQHEDVLLLAR